MLAEPYFKNIQLPAANIALETKMIDMIMDHHNGDIGLILYLPGAVSPHPPPPHHNPHHHQQHHDHHHNYRSSASTALTWTAFTKQGFPMEGCSPITLRPIWIGKYFDHHHLFHKYEHHLLYYSLVSVADPQKSATIA